MHDAEISMKDIQIRSRSKRYRTTVEFACIKNVEVMKRVELKDSFFIYPSIFSRQISVEIGKEDRELNITIVTHTFILPNFHYYFHTCVPILETLDFSFEQSITDLVMFVSRSFSAPTSFHLGQCRLKNGNGNCLLGWTYSKNARRKYDETDRQRHSGGIYCHWRDHHRQFTTSTCIPYLS